jgi:phosphoribosylamine--glycine ligase (EC 6.3.4.13)
LPRGAIPARSKRALPIEVGPVADDALLFHAGTAVSEGRWVTAGGRVMGATGLGPDLPAARSAAYRAAEQVRFEGAWFRPDIGN